jgi:protein TonB
MFRPRLIAIAISFVVHACLLGGIFVLTESAPDQDIVYQVSLVDTIGAKISDAKAAPEIAKAAPEIAKAAPAPTPLKVPAPLSRPMQPAAKAAAPLSRPVQPAVKAAAPSTRPAQPPAAPRIAQPVPEPVVSEQIPTPAQQVDSASPSNNAPVIASDNDPNIAPNIAPDIPARSRGPVLHPGGLYVYDVDSVDTPPVLLKRSIPEYPPRARRLHIQGEVVIRLIVDASGNPRDSRIEEAHPKGYFEQAALTAVGKTRFSPGLVEGKAVNTVVLIPFIFNFH